MSDASFNQPSAVIELSYELFGLVFTLMHQLLFFLINHLSEFLKSVCHVLLGRMVLLADLPLSLLKALILQRQIVNLVVYLHGEIFHCLEYLWISFFQQGDIVTFVLAKNDTFGADGQ